MHELIETKILPGYKVCVYENSDSDGGFFSRRDGPPEIYEIAYTLDGNYIGSPKLAKFLFEKSIEIEEKSPYQIYHNIGFCQKEQKWYGWRSCYDFCRGFGIGYIVTEQEFSLRFAAAEEQDLPVGYKIQTLEEAKKVASSFARKL